MNGKIGTAASFEPTEFFVTHGGLVVSKKTWCHRVYMVTRLDKGWLSKHLHRKTHWPHQHNPKVFKLASNVDKIIPRLCGIMWTRMGMQAQEREGYDSGSVPLTQGTRPKPTAVHGQQKQSTKLREPYCMDASARFQEHHRHRDG